MAKHKPLCPVERERKGKEAFSQLYSIYLRRRYEAGKAGDRLTMTMNQLNINGHFGKFGAADGQSPRVSLAVTGPCNTPLRAGEAVCPNCARGWSTEGDRITPAGYRMIYWKQKIKAA